MVDGPRFRQSGYCGALLVQVFCSVRSERLLMEAEPPDSRPRITYRVLGFSPPFAAMEDQLLPSISL